MKANGGGQAAGPLLRARARWEALRVALVRRRAHSLDRRSERLAERSDQLAERAQAVARREKQARSSGELVPRQRLERRRRAQARAVGGSTWLYVLKQVGSREGVRFLLKSGLLGGRLPRSFGLPPGDRILVLAAHQDDEGIGAGGTLLQCARAGKQVCIAYLTDGATALGGLDLEHVSRVRYAEAQRAWRRVRGVEVRFVGQPAASPDVAPASVDQLLSLLEEFRPDTLFVLSFLEEPHDHRLVTRWLLEADRRRPLDPALDVWGYQVTTRVPGNAVVDITPVWRRKRRLNRAWHSQNAIRDYAHLALGRDIANSEYLKHPRLMRPAAAYAEVFVRFDARRYADLCHEFLGLAESVEESLEGRAPSPPPDFLVVGLQKAGTYWLSALLDAHPQIRCFPSRPGHADGTGEVHLFDLLARMDRDFESARQSLSKKLGGYFADVLSVEAPEGKGERAAQRARLAERFSEYCDGQRRRHGKVLVGEKTPETIHHLDLVEALFPGIKKVCILRDPRDRVVSFHHHQVRKGRIEAGPVGAKEVAKYTDRVRRDYEGLLDIREPFFLTTYERLSQEPVAVVGELLRFLGAYSSSEQAAELVEAASLERLAGRPRGIADDASHFRAGLVGSWREELDADLAESMATALEEPTRRLEERFGLDLSGYRAAAPVRAV
jgi:LmbE family N-acetylglucosaminyl deacetylase